MEIFAFSFIILSLILYVWTIIKIDSKDPMRLFWYVILFIFPLLGPIIFLAFYFKKKRMS